MVVTFIVHRSPEHGNRPRITRGGIPPSLTGDQGTIFPFDLPNVRDPSSKYPVTKNSNADEKKFEIAIADNNPPS